MDERERVYCLRVAQSHLGERLRDINKEASLSCGRHYTRNAMMRHIQEGLGTAIDEIQREIDRLCGAREYNIATKSPSAPKGER